MANEKIRVMCPNLPCRSILNVPNRARGKIVRCSKCGFRVKIPMPKKVDAAGMTTTASSHL